MTDETIGICVGMSAWLIYRHEEIDDRDMMSDLRDGIEREGRRKASATATGRKQVR